MPRPPPPCPSIPSLSHMPARKPQKLRDSRLSPSAYSVQDAKGTSQRSSTTLPMPKPRLSPILGKCNTKISKPPMRQPPHPASQRRYHLLYSLAQLCYPSAHDANQPPPATHIRHSSKCKISKTRPQRASNPDQIISQNERLSESLKHVKNTSPPWQRSSFKQDHSPLRLPCTAC